MEILNTYIFPGYFLLITTIFLFDNPLQKHLLEYKVPLLLVSIVLGFLNVWVSNHLSKLKEIEIKNDRAAINLYKAEYIIELEHTDKTKLHEFPFKEKGTASIQLFFGSRRDSPSQEITEHHHIGSWDNSDMGIIRSNIKGKTYYDPLNGTIKILFSKPMNIFTSPKTARLIPGQNYFIWAQTNSGHGVYFVKPLRVVIIAEDGRNYYLDKFQQIDNLGMRYETSFSFRE